MNMGLSPSGEYGINCLSKDATIFGTKRSDLLKQIAVDLNL